MAMGQKPNAKSRSVCLFRGWPVSSEDLVSHKHGLGQAPPTPITTQEPLAHRGSRWHLPFPSVPHTHVPGRRGLGP